MLLVVYFGENVSALQLCLMHNLFESSECMLLFNPCFLANSILLYRNNWFLFEIWKSFYSCIIHFRFFLLLLFFSLKVTHSCAYPIFSGNQAAAENHSHIWFKLVKLKPTILLHRTDKLLFHHSTPQFLFKNYNCMSTDLTFPNVCQLNSGLFGAQGIVA